jgi:hypothetical protein
MKTNRMLLDWIRWRVTSKFDVPDNMTRISLPSRTEPGREGRRISRPERLSNTVVFESNYRFEVDLDSGGPRPQAKLTGSV